MAGESHLAPQPKLGGTGGCYDHTTKLTVKGCPSLQRAGAYE